MREYVYRIGKFSNWKKTIQSGGKKSFIKDGIIQTAKILVRDIQVLLNINFVLSESGDEVLIERTRASTCDKKKDQVGDGSSNFSSDEIKSMDLKNGINQAVFCGGENLGNIKIHFSIYLLHQTDR